MLSGTLELHLHRGELDQARGLLSRFDELGPSAEVQAQSTYHGAVAAVRLAEGDLRSALSAGAQAFDARAVAGITTQAVKFGFVHALEAALALGDDKKAEELLTIVEQQPVGLCPPLLTVEGQLEHGEWLADRGRHADAERLIAEARETFEQLGAVPWLERAAGALRAGREPEPEPVPAG
jgi:hypothetical protein